MVFNREISFFWPLVPYVFASEERLGLSELGERASAFQRIGQKAAKAINQIIRVAPSNPFFDGSTWSLIKLVLRPFAFCFAAHSVKFVLASLLEKRFAFEGGRRPSALNASDYAD